MSDRIKDLPDAMIALGQLSDATREMRSIPTHVYATPEYDILGIRWESEPVSLIFGENNQSDKRVVNPFAQIAVITDVATFDAAFPGYIISSENGTSLRVMCQRIGRKFKGTAAELEPNRKAVLDAIRGVRAKTTATTRRGLPDGTFYHGTDENEYRRLYIAAMVDADPPVPAALAAAIVARLPW